VEARDSFSQYQPPSEIINFLNKYSFFYIIGHSEPDGDCLGSQLALGSFLSRRGTGVKLHSPGPFNRPEISELSKRFEERIDRNTIPDNSAAILLDCSSLDRIGELKKDISGMPICVIDHHASGSLFGDVRWIIPSAPSVTLMIQMLIRHFDERPTEEEAQNLFFGLATDTGFFRHLDTTGSDSFRAAADLIDAGCSPKVAFLKMYGNRPFESRLLLGRLLGRCRTLYEGRLLYTWETLDDLESFGSESRDSDILYQLLLGTRRCQAAAVIREERPGICSAGLRSLYDLDVGEIAKYFGGGGHAKAAGFSFSGTRKELERILLPRFLFPD
jgi:bifunctional oligoribonuclease and PAP phosphatase NrnA